MSASTDDAARRWRRSAARSPSRAPIEEAVLPPLVALLVAAIVGDVLILSLRPESRARSTGCCSRARGGTRTASARCSTRRRRSRSPDSPSRSACAPDCSTSAPRASSRRADSARRSSGSLLPAGLPALLALPVYLVAAALGGGVVGGSSRRAQGEVRRARSDHDDHAQLHRARAAQLSHGDASARAGARCTRRRSTPARCRGSRRSSPPSTARRRTSCSCSRCSPRCARWWFLFRTRRGFELRAVGLQPRRGGVRRRRRRRRVVARDGAVRRARRHRRAELRARLQALLRGRRSRPAPDSSASRWRSSDATTRSASCSRRSSSPRCRRAGSR